MPVTLPLTIDTKYSGLPILLDALMTCPAGLVLVTNRGAIPRKFEGIVGRYSVQYDDKSFDIILQN